MRRMAYNLAHLFLQAATVLLLPTISRGDEHKKFDGVYDYSIPYHYSIGDFDGISSPRPGKEIKQMDVSKVKKPNQIRLSFTGEVTEMAISWNTNSVSHYEEVHYGLVEGDLNFTARSISHQFKWHWLEEEGKFLYTSGFIHEALMVNLIPGRIHFYQVREFNRQIPIVDRAKKDRY